MRIITDLHCHLLPGLDDGAKDWSVSWKMLNLAVDSGVGRIVCTPHCTFGDPCLPKRIKTVRQMTEVLNRVLSQQKLSLKVLPGAEMLWEDGIIPLREQMEGMTLAGSRYLLVEFRFGERLSQMEWVANQVAISGLVPVLAHPERYAAVQREPICLVEWFRNGWGIQVDKDSVLGDFGDSANRTVLWALERGLAHVVASDAHNASQRTPCFQRLDEFLALRFSPQYGELLLRRNPSRIVENTELVRA